MSKIFNSITELVGHTPLLRLNGFEKKRALKAEIIIKLEYYNPNQSVKDRIALSMIEDAEKSGKLKPGGTIIEVTSGNTGIGLAAIAAAKGYGFITYIQDTVSAERFKVIDIFGGRTIKLFDIPEVKEIAETIGPDFVTITNVIEKKVAEEFKGAVMVNQCSNPANPDIHKRTTGPEIWEDTGGKIDFFVATVGTGGTISGAGAYLKSKNPKLKVVAVEPHPDSVPNKENPEPEEITGVHPFTYVDPAWVPQNFNKDIFDESYQVRTEEAYEIAREIAKTDGILIGTSSGAAVHAALEIAKKPENKGKRIVAVSPDTGLRYLSTNLFGKIQEN